MEAALKKDVQEVFQLVEACPQHLQQRTLEILLQHTIHRQTMNSLDESLGNIQKQLSCLADDAQLANVDLQNALQRQQQTVQMIANITKLLQDTALSVIRNINS